MCIPTMVLMPLEAMLSNIFSGPPVPPVMSTNIFPAVRFLEPTKILGPVPNFAAVLYSGMALSMSSTSPMVLGAFSSNRRCRYVATMLSAGVCRHINGMPSRRAASTAREWLAGMSLRSTSLMRFSMRASAVLIGTPNRPSMSDCMPMTS